MKPTLTSGRRQDTTAVSGVKVGVPPLYTQASTMMRTALNVYCLKYLHILAKALSLAHREKEGCVFFA